MITNLIGGVFDLLGRAGGRGSRRPVGDEPDPAPASSGPDGYRDAFAVPVARGEAPDVSTRAGEILDSQMRHSPDPRTGRIPRGVYRGKTPAEAALSARREAENQAKNKRGGDAFAVPLNRASSGLDALNATQRAAQASAARRASGDMRGVSFWKNNGDGTATSGRYGADNKAVTRTADIVPRVKPGESRVVPAGGVIPRPDAPDTHLVIGDNPDGTTSVRGRKQVVRSGSIFPRPVGV